MIAAHETGRPICFESAANSSTNRSGPQVASTIPTPRVPSSPASVKISSSDRRAGSARACRRRRRVTSHARWRSRAAPASSASPTSRRIASTSPEVAARSVAASPITYWRTGVWPTNAATLMRSGSFATAARYSGNVSKPHGMPCSSASSVMPSTFSRMRAISGRSAGRVGAMPKPQLPITTVVTPCQKRASVPGPRTPARRSACGRR